MEETVGYTGAVGTYLSGVYIRTDLYNPDTDNDGLTDGEEKIKGTNPFVLDTDGDGISDNIDQELTPKGQRWYVDANGKFDSAKYDNRDDDKDGISDTQESLGCLFSQIGAEVYTTTGEYYGCTQQQKVALIRLNSAESLVASLSGTLASLSGTGLAEAQQQLIQAQEKVNQATQQVQKASDPSFFNIS